MKKVFHAFLMALAVCLPTTKADGQLSSNPDKFLGNITTGYQIDYGNEKFYQLWNQITPENESKWDQVEGSRRGSFNWTNTDRIYNYAKQHKFPFKWHTLIWGSQYPNWLNSLSEKEQYKAIEEWMDAIKKKYPDLPMIDVVNEAISGHAPAPYKNALGGDGVTGYDWIIRAFEMAHERWPNAILIYNDYNTFQWNTDQFIDLVRTLRDAGAPIDAYGCQSHDLTDCSVSDFKNAMTKLQNALKMPMYSTEYDIGTADDALQLQRYKEQIPYMWESDYCAGITLWGYIYGRTWVTDGNSGIIKDGKDRPAMTWLREYMASDKAKEAKSPFPGMVKEASVYVKPSSLRVTKGQPVSVEVKASMRTKTIDHVDFYMSPSVGASPTKLVQTLTEAPYFAECTPAAKGKYNLKAVVTTTDGTIYERLSSVTAYNERKAHKEGMTLPGTIQFEDFDEGGEGMTYHDSDAKDEGDAKYRSDSEGVDMVKGGTGTAIGYTATGEWLEYSVEVTESGSYTYEAYVSSGNSGASFSVSLMNDGKATQLCKVNVPQTGNNDWSKYQTVKGDVAVPLEAGRHVLRVTIEGPYGNLDKITFKRVKKDADPDFHIYLCFGQSNMEGNAQWEEVDEKVDSRFQMLATTDFDTPKRTLGNWYTAECPIVSPVGKLGMADYFGRTMVAAMPSNVKIGVIAVAMGGSPIEMFDKDKYQQKLSENPNEWWATLSKNYYGGNPYGRLIDMARKAQESGVIKGILLHQGCTNNGDPNWPSMVKKIYNDILTDLGLRAEDVPLFAGETERQDMGGGCYAHNTVVNQLPDVIPTAHVVHSNGIPGNGQDPWHFSASGYRTFGKRYALENLRVIGRDLQKDPAYVIPENLAGFYTLVKLEESTIQVPLGSNKQLAIWGTFADGHREELSGEATFTSSDYPVTDGVISATVEGSGTVTATYTDFTGQQHTATITVDVKGNGINQRFTSLDQIKSESFAIVDEKVGKAFYGIDNQNLGFDEYAKAFGSNITGYYFKLESLAKDPDESIRKCYLLRLIQPNGTPYNIWGSPGYLNSQEATGWCSFILGLNNQNGQDIKNGAVWEIEYVDEKGFTLKNKGTGKYLHDAMPAKYDDPAYFTFCTIGSTTAIQTMKTDVRNNGFVYSLQGVKLGTLEQWESLPRGIYIVNGRKVKK